MGTAQLRNMWGLMMSERVNGRVWTGIHSMTGSKENVPLIKLTLPSLAATEGSGVMAAMSTSSSVTWGHSGA